MRISERALLTVENLAVSFHVAGRRIQAVDGVDLVIERGQTAALVGESGSGKSVTALALSRLIPSPPGVYERGRIVFDGADVLSMDARALRRLRGGGIAYVFQEPAHALNPVLNVGEQVSEAVRGQTGPGVREAGMSLLRMTGMPDPERCWRAYPHELSGGMKQRVVLAMALAARPRLLVADEPTTALDVTIQAQILAHLKTLQKSLGLTVLLITHNLGLVAGYASDVHVMYAGQIVEWGRTEDVLRRPAHPYTRGLLDAVPSIRADADLELVGIPGRIPDPADVPSGCRFAPRCPHADTRCAGEPPRQTAFATGGSLRSVRCHYPLTETVTAETE